MEKRKINGQIESTEFSKIQGFPVWGVLWLLGSKNRADLNKNKNEIVCRYFFRLTYKPCLGLTPTWKAFPAFIFFSITILYFRFYVSCDSNKGVQLTDGGSQSYNYIDQSKLEGLKWLNCRVQTPLKSAKNVWKV